MVRPATTVVIALMLAGCNRTQATQCSTAAGQDEVCIPGGSFMMGHEPIRPPPSTAFVPIESAAFNNWGPVHEVRLSAFFIDRLEVTWAQYALCVDAGICGVDGITTYESTKRALRDPAMAARPAYEIRWADADAFCRWVGKRLPTEAEWERAARGVAAHDYPWGDARPSAALLKVPTRYYADWGFPERYPPEVGSSPDDVSEDGVHDLFSSVAEWVHDWYAPGYSDDGVSFDPPGPSRAFVRPFQLTAAGRVVRGDRWSLAGGATWDRAASGAAAWFRDQAAPSVGRGFRCARGDELPKSELPLYRGLQWRGNGRSP